MKKTLCALAVLSTTSLPVMAAGVDIKVVGTIEPTACTLSLPTGASIDYDVIDPSLLSATAFTPLAEKQIDITLSCDAPAKMGLMAVNGRPATMAGATEGLSGAGRAPVSLFGSTTTDGVGLGLDGTDKIGGYGIRLVPGTVTTDTDPADVITKGSAESVWAKSPTGTLYESTKLRHTSWAAPGTVIPVAFKAMTGKIGVQAYINKKADLDVTKSIILNGLTTLELVYL